MGKQKMRRNRILSLALVLLLLLGLFPTSALAVTRLDPVPDEAAEESVLIAEKAAQFDASGFDQRLLDKKGIDAGSVLTQANKPGASAEETDYVKSVAGMLTEQNGIIGLEDYGAGDQVFVMVWLQELPDALERVYKEENMSISSYAGAASDAALARNTIRALGTTPGSSGTGRSSAPLITIEYEYFEVFAGFAVKATKSVIEEIAAMPGVYAVTEVGYASMDDYIPDPNYDVPGNGGAREAMEIADLHADGIDGTGVKVGVIDSGIDATHPDLKDVYKGGYNFADKTADMTRQDGNHGTHVSGTIASQGVNSLGVAPGVDLYMGQVFTATRPNSASEADTTAAIEAFTKGDAAKGLLKVDIINMSMGNQVNSAYVSDHFTRNNAVIAGVLIVCSAGNNAYPEKNTTDRRNYTLGSGGVSLPLSVAASKYGGDWLLNYTMTASNELGGSDSISVTAENKDGSMSGLYHAESFGSTNTFSITYNAANSKDDTNTWLDVAYYGTYERHPLVYVEGKGYELYYACSTAADMTVDELTALKALPKDSLIGKILVVNRGQAFNDYFGEALRLGAGAFIVLNRVESYIGNMASGNVATAAMSVFSGPVSGRQKLLDVIAAGGVAYLAPSSLTKDALEMEPADFSSIGPVNETAQIKPDVIAPGWNIVSTSLDGGYDRMGGTSMSSPWVAGVAALVKQQYPNATPAEIKARIMNTANPDLIKPLSSRLLNPNAYFNEAGTETSVFEQGAGFVNPKRAVYADTYITVQNDVPTGASDKSVMTAQMGSFSFGNADAGSTTNKLTATVHGAADYDISATYNNDTRYSGSSEGVIEVKYTTSGSSFDVWLEIAEEATTDPMEGNLYEGYIVVTANDAEYVLPWAVRVGEPPVIEEEEDDWLIFPTRPIQATYNHANQEYAPYSSQNFMYFSFYGETLADSVVLRRSGSNYYMDILLINVDNPDVPAYRYQVGLGTGAAGLVLSDFIETDGGVYQIQVAARAYARNANGTWATSVSNVAAGSYYIGLEFRDSATTTYYNYYYQLGVTFASTRPTLTIHDATTSATGTELGDVKLAANGNTYGIYPYGTREYTARGTIYSAAIDAAANAGKTGFYWAGYYLLEHDAIIPLAQDLNVLEDSSLLGYLVMDETGSPWICDADGNFSITVDTPTNKSNAYLFNFNRNASTGEIEFVANGTGHALIAVDAFDVTQATSTQYATIGNLTAFTWTPYVREAPLKVVADIRGSATGSLEAPVEYIISLLGMEKVLNAGITFEVDESMLEGKGLEVISSAFTALDLSEHGTEPIRWTNMGGGVWQGEIMLMNFGTDGFTSYAAIDIAKVIYNARKIGDATMKLTKLEVVGIDKEDKVVYLNSEIKTAEATTSIVKVYSIYDLNKDGVIDALDLGIAQRYYQAKVGDANWEAAKVCDFDGNGIVNMLDLIELFRQYAR